MPGFTGICESLGIIKENPFYTREGCDKGIALHLWLQFILRGKNPKDAPDARILKKVEGIRKFIRDTEFKIVGGEEPMYDPVNNFACTPDLYGYISNWSYVIDMKSGAKQTFHPLQTAAQKIALIANGFRCQKRAALYLKEDGYRLVEHSDPDDMTRWKHYVRKYHKEEACLPKN